MALFDFFKKKEQKVEKKRIQKATLNRKKYPRYRVEGLEVEGVEVLDISLNSLSLKMGESSLEVGDRISLMIDGSSYDAVVVRKEEGVVAVVLDKEFDRTFMEKHVMFKSECKIDSKKSFNIQAINDNVYLDFYKTILILLLEIEDSNANIYKVASLIDEIPQLKTKIFKYANSVVNMKQKPIREDTEVAIARIGFENLKEIIHDFVYIDISLMAPQLASVKNLEIMNIFLLGFFKKIAPRFGFQDIRKEGESLLVLSYIGATFLANSNHKIEHLYHSIDQLYSYEMRLIERFEEGVDLLEIDRIYFTQLVGVFKDIYDGYILAHMMLYPSYRPQSSLTISQTTLRYAYLVYLSVIALRAVVMQSRFDSTILYQRLKRFGLDEGGAKEFIEELLLVLNEKLKILHIKKKIVFRDFKESPIELEPFFKKEQNYLMYIKKGLIDFEQKTKRMAIGYEDEIYTHMMLEVMLNLSQFEIAAEVFCVLESSMLKNDSLSLEQFEIVDLILFKNIDLLPKHLIDDFEKLWRDFDGKIVVTFSLSHLIEIHHPKLYRLICEYIVDFTIIQQSEELRFNMLSDIIERMKRIKREEICSLDDFNDKKAYASCVYKTCLEKL